MDHPGTSTDVCANLMQVKRSIAAAARRAGRDPNTVTLLPVTKTVPLARIQHAIEMGEKRFGENKVQEADQKFQSLANPSIRWVVIGHLQSNKAKDVARFASELQSLDRLKLAHALERRLQQDGRSIDVLIQVNTSNESSKYGLPPDQVDGFLSELKHFDCLRIRGLMTLALFSSDLNRVRECFRCLRRLRDQLRDYHNTIDLSKLSMGMSGDYQVAIDEGSTEVRIGQAIFGPRAYPDSYYWPSEVTK